MILRKEEMNVRTLQNAKGGEGSVNFVDWLPLNLVPGYGPTISKVVIPVGSSIGYHRHEGTFEAIYILKGQATLNDEGNELTLYPGDMNFCPEGHCHSVANTGTEPLEMMALILNDRSKEA